MTDTMDIATVLEEVADLLLMRGVCRTGSYGDPGGPRCVMGALAEVLGLNTETASSRDSVWRHPAVDVLFDAVPDRNLIEWNDASEDDFEVIDTLRHLAKDIRNGQA